MSWFVDDELVDVEVPGCNCPGTPHASETFGMLAEPSPDLALAAKSAIWRALPDDSMREAVGRVYIEYGVKRWTLVDEKGEPLEVTRALLRRLKWAAVEPLAEKGAELYSETIFRPLADRASNSSPPGAIVPLTSQRRRSSTARRTA